MRNLTIFILVVLALSSCKNKKNLFNKSFNTDSLKVQNFSINIHRDTTVETQGGIKIIIAANSINADANIITLEVKEALNIADMVKAGLFTISGKDILSSDGMFYIGTKENSTINKPLTVLVPKGAPDNAGMKLYKGNETADGMDWVDPEEITKSKTDSTVILGEKLFAANCTSCHYSSRDAYLVGSSLMGLDKIRSRQWLYDFTKDNEAFRKSGDVQACCVYNKFNHTEMPRYLNFGNKELEAIYIYLANETRKNYGENFKSRNGCDSCEYYQQLLDERYKLVQENSSQINFINEPVSSSNSPTTNVIARPNNKVVYVETKAEYYQLDIKVYGWYNIDILLKDRNNNKSSVLKVYVKIPFEMDISVMLVIPDEKVYAHGGKLDDDKGYGFLEKNGDIILPQNENAYIIAYAEDSGKIYFNIKKFITNLNQKIQLDMPLTNKENVMKVIQTFNIQDVQMDISRTKNADKIGAIDSILSRFKFESENCHCSVSEDSVYNKYK